MADPKVGTTPTPAQAASTPAPGQSVAGSGDSPPSFTPGPWSARDYKTERKGIWIDSFATVRGKVMGTVCEVHPLKHQEANARLIAAAPDLYRALSDLVNELPDVAIDVFREVAGNSNASALRARRSAAIKALARARGEVAQWV